jgi:hypothetical protein
MKDEPALGLLLCDDLMWISRITGTAHSLGLKIAAARTVEQLEVLARRQPPRCVILDLDAARIPPTEIVSRVTVASGTAPRFTAFGSHVDVATLQAACDAGCDPVLPRSKMAEALPLLLQEWLT